MLSPRMRQFLDRLPSVLVAKPGPRARGAASSPDVLARLLEATLHFRVTTMRYHSVSSGRIKDYLVHPYRWPSPRAAALLACALNTRQSAPSPLIASASAPEKQTFTVTQAVGEDVFANSLGVNTGPAEQVEIEFDARVAPYVRARVWHPSQQIEDARDGRRISDVERVPRLGRSWILSWGPFARVVSPPGWRRRSTPIWRRRARDMWRRLRSPQLRTPMKSPLRFGLLALVLGCFLPGRPPALLRTGCGSAKSATRPSSS